MSLRRLLAHLERLAEPLRNAPKRCRTCGAPDPCVPSVVVLTPDGFYEPLGAPPPCPACGADSAVVAVDPETGEPVQPIKEIHLGVDWNEWLERHKDREFPAPYARWLQSALQ